MIAVPARLRMTKAQAEGEEHVPAPAPEQPRTVAPHRSTIELMPSFGRMNQVREWISWEVLTLAGKAAASSNPPHAHLEIRRLPACPARSPVTSCATHALPIPAPVQMFREMEREMAEMSRAFGMPSLMPTWSSAMFDLPAAAADLPAMTAKRWASQRKEAVFCCGVRLLQHFSSRLLAGCTCQWEMATAAVGNPCCRPAPSLLAPTATLLPCTRPWARPAAWRWT